MYKRYNFKCFFIYKIVHFEVTNEKSFFHVTHIHKVKTLFIVKIPYHFAQLYCWLCEPFSCCYLNRFIKDVKMQFGSIVGNVSLFLGCQLLPEVQGFQKMLGHAQKDFSILSKIQKISFCLFKFTLRSYCYCALLRERTLLVWNFEQGSLDLSGVDLEIFLNW